MIIWDFLYIVYLKPNTHRGDLVLALVASFQTISKILIIGLVTNPKNNSTNSFIVQRNKNMLETIITFKGKRTQIRS